MTIDDVASRAGVSTATVSRVLSGSRRVRPDSAARVRAAAQQLDYSVNPIARALRSSRTGTIGMVVPSIANPFFISLVEGVEQELGGQDRQLFLCNARSDPALERVQLRALADRNVDGIIISPTSGTDSVAAIVEAARDRPVVQLDRFVDGTGTDWVGVDDDAAMQLVVEHLAAVGVRTAAFVGAETTHSSSERRHAGLVRSARKVGITVRARDVLLGDYSVAWGEQALARIVDRGVLPDAVVCGDDLIALGVLRAAAARRLRVPRDLAVTGYDDIDLARLTQPALTTIAQPRKEITAEAVRLLLSDRPASGPTGSATKITLAPHLVVRDSTPAR